MKTIINNHLSLMLDELLEKALKEKPDLISKYTVIYKNFFSIYILDDDLYEITIAVRKNKESMGNSINYVYSLTDKQKELIKKIFQKWSKENETNN